MVFSYTEQVSLILISVISTAVVALLINYFSSRRGNRVIVTRISETPQIVISPNVQSDLEIRFKNNAVKNLVINSLTISNRGKKVVENFTVELKISPDNEELSFLEVSNPKDALEKTKVEIKERTLIISREFLNSRNRYKEEELGISILSNCRLKISVIGGGKDWYSRFVDRKEPITPRNFALKILLLFGCFSGLFSIETFGVNLAISPNLLFTFYIIVFVFSLFIIFLLFRDLPKN
jgi:hypothetical protein